MTPRTFGWRSPESLGRAPHAGARTAVAGTAGLREQVLLEHLPPVYDQHAVGSCTAQALAAGIEALLPRAGYAAERPDRAALYLRERQLIGTANEDSGAIIADGVAVLGVGWEREEAEPPGTWGERWTRPPRPLADHAPRLVSTEPLDFDVATIATELDAGHPVVVGLQVTEDWMSFDGDTLPEPSGPVVGGHAVLLVGYDLARRCWRVRNSWGTSWRDGGYAWLPFAWTRAPWCGEAHAMRVVRRVDAPLPPRALPADVDELLGTPLDAMEAGILAAMAPPSATAPATAPRHALDPIGGRWMWLYPLPSDPMKLVDELRRHGVTGVIPQQSAQAIAWARRWAPALEREGFATMIGLGRITAANTIAALGVESAVGVMQNQEVWKSVADSNALCEAVLKAVPDAAARMMDCHYPCLTKDPETDTHTGWHRIAKAWSPICGLRAPQCYWARGGGGTTDGPRDGWVAARLAWARLDYPRAGGSPADRVRVSRQLYRASTQDHVELLLAESLTGSVFIWNWAEADISAKLALRIVVELERRGFCGPGAIERYQRAEGLKVDGLLGPKTCAALGILSPRDVLWRRRR
ncbi:MAG: C1 family peptidase [Polyangiales bacterium]